jgi:hypothetical protein
MAIELYLQGVNKVSLQLVHRRNTTGANYCIVVFRADSTEMIGSIRCHVPIDASVDPTEAGK